MKPLSPPLIFILCAFLVLARGLGLHVHHEHSDHHHSAAVEAAPAHSHHDVVSDIAGDHLAEHMAHGEVDADFPDKTTGKLQSVLAIALLSTIVALLFLPRPRPQYFRVRREHRRRRRWTHFKPLSHAPPLAG